MRSVKKSIASENQPSENSTGRRPMKNEIRIVEELSVLYKPSIDKTNGSWDDNLIQQPLLIFPPSFNVLKDLYCRHVKTTACFGKGKICPERIGRSGSSRTFISVKC